MRKLTVLWADGSNSRHDMGREIGIRDGCWFTFRDTNGNICRINMTRVDMMSIGPYEEKTDVDA